MTADPRRPLGQYMTPEWVAQELVAAYFGDLTLCDRVLEPSCGEGAFLAALPEHVPAIGVEIDPVLADRARRNTGREILVGDFATTALPFRPTAIIGNPPFAQAQVQAFLSRAWELLPNDGRVGFILPAFVFQTASTVATLADRWHIAQDMLPRNLFPGLSTPICFARLTKGRRGLVGFALYHEAHAVNRLQQRYRRLLAQGERATWGTLTRAALQALGGSASLTELYREIEGERPTHNRFWRAKVRQQVQRIGYRVGPGRWALAA